MRSERGFSLVEVLVTLVLVATVAVGYISSLGVASKILLMADSRETAKDLAQAQLEYIQNQTYDSVNNPPVYQILPDLAGSYSGYSIATPIATRLDKGAGISSDTGIQQIIIAVRRGTTPVLTLMGEKVNW